MNTSVETTIAQYFRKQPESLAKDIRTINEHIQNIYSEAELKPESTIRKFRIVQIKGTREVARAIDFYNLDVIISIGYRVSSHRGTQFRIWATGRLKEYLIKGFTLDDERLKQGGKSNYIVSMYLDFAKPLIPALQICQ
jgi:hypothetical protein